MAMIETHKLAKTFKSRKGPVEAVRGVDLHVNEGEIFGFLGPNGAGKTTTMRMLSTLLDPSDGQATVCGYDLRRDPAKVRTQIGYVGQKGGAEARETGRENLVLQGRLYGMNKADALKRAAELVSRLELETFADRLAKTYSGGQRRRLDIAMGMMHRPRLLILDEPTTGLDPQSRMRIWDEVRSLRAEGMTIFLTSHYMDEADTLCDRLAIMDNGKIVGEDTPRALKQQIAGRYYLAWPEHAKRHQRQGERKAARAIVPARASGDRRRLATVRGARRRGAAGSLAPAGQQRRDDSQRDAGAPHAGRCVSAPDRALPARRANRLASPSAIAISVRGLRPENPQEG